MKEMILVEYGASYSRDPWEPRCVCQTEKDAKAYIERQSQFASLYHTTKLPLEGEEPLDEQSEYEYILECIESSEDLDEMIVMQQLRCLWTAYCLHQNLDVDTAEYDNRMMEMWNVMQENESAPYSSLEYGRFYNVMSKYLV